MDGLTLGGERVERCQLRWKGKSSWQNFKSECELTLALLSLLTLTC